jgi:hypothetical protein
MLLFRGEVKIRMGNDHRDSIFISPMKEDNFSVATNHFQGNLVLGSDCLVRWHLMTRSAKNVVKSGKKGFEPQTRDRTVYYREKQESRMADSSVGQINAEDVVKNWISVEEERHCQRSKKWR